MKANKRFPLAKALSWIGLSALCINGTFYLLLQGYFIWRDQKQQFKQATVHSIIQTGPQKEALKTDYLAQLLGLSKDRPIKMKDFDFQAAQKKLLSSPVIKEAELKTVDLGTLYLDYTIRQPIATLYDLENHALDEEQILFPLIPFFAPKNLPEIYLGLSDKEITTKLEGPKVELALNVLKLIKGPSVKEELNIKRIDVSKALERSYGRQEIVIIVQDEFLSKYEDKQVHYYLTQYLRLTCKNYAQELGNYLKLRDELLKKEEAKLPFPQEGQTAIQLKSKVIDLRLEQLAFINE